MLDVSRRTAIFFNKETGLQPDLVVVSPLRRAIQSAIISFPTYTPHLSLSNTPWICHPLCMEQANGNKSEFVSSSEELNRTFPGVDYTLFDEMVDGNVDELNGREKVPLFESKVDLMRRTNEFLAWIKKREERVIVGKCHIVDIALHALTLLIVLTISLITSTQFQVTRRGCIHFAHSRSNMNTKARALKCLRKEN
jgi:hypothetical protein